MPKPGWEPRPVDAEYYAWRTEWVRQGDLFHEVPTLAYPFPPEAIDHSEGKRRFLAGPFESGVGMLLTPTCTMSAQGIEGPAYATPIRALAPVLALDELLERGVIKEAALPDLREYDHLNNYFYLPSMPDVGMPESLALLYAPMTIHHDYLEDKRIAQLAVPAAVHLKRQLTAHVSGLLLSYANFTD